MNLGRSRNYKCFARALAGAIRKYGRPASILTVLHPETNGKVERFFRTVKEKLPELEGMEELVRSYNEKRPRMSLNLDVIETPIRRSSGRCQSRGRSSTRNQGRHTMPRRAWRRGRTRFGMVQWKHPMFVAPSPKKQTVTLSSFFNLGPNARPAAAGIPASTMRRSP